MTLRQRANRQTLAIPVSPDLLEQHRYHLVAISAEATTATRVRARTSPAASAKTRERTCRACHTSARIATPASGLQRRPGPRPERRSHPVCFICPGVIALSRPGRLSPATRKERSAALELSFQRERKRCIVRYEEQVMGAPPVVGTLYLQKFALAEARAQPARDPDCLRVTIEVQGGCGAPVAPVPKIAEPVPGRHSSGAGIRVARPGERRRPGGGVGCALTAPLSDVTLGDAATRTHNRDYPAVPRPLARPIASRGHVVDALRCRAQAEVGAEPSRRFCGGTSTEARREGPRREYQPRTAHGRARDRWTALQGAISSRATGESRSASLTSASMAEVPTTPMTPCVSVAEVLRADDDVRRSGGETSACRSLGCVERPAGVPQRA